MDGLGLGVDAINAQLQNLQQMIFGEFKDSKGKMDNQFTDFIDMIRQLKDTGDLEEQMDKEENKKFLTKLYNLVERIWYDVMESFLILYIPICWYLITRKGYNVGGTNLNNFPYRDPNVNKKSFNQVAQLYKQAGGGEIHLKFWVHIKKLVFHIMVF